MATAATLAGILRGFGIPPGPFSSLINQAVIFSWTPEQLLAELYNSPAFGAMFPGIFGGAGQLKMSPGEYLQARESYRHMARVYGFPLSSATFGSLVQRNVSQQEFVDRLEAGARIKENPVFMRQLRRTIGSRPGVEGGVTKKKALDFMLGLAPKQFYDVWEQTVLQATARLSGIKLSPRLAKRIQRLSPGRIDEGTAKMKMEELAQHIKTTLPLSRIHKLGLSKADLIQLEFGGKRQAEIAEKAKRIIATEAAFIQEPRARTSSRIEQVGLKAAQERPQVQ